MSLKVSRARKIILCAFAFLVVLGFVLIIETRQGPTTGQQLIFIGFTNVSGTACGMFESPAWYSPPRWIFSGAYSVRAEAQVQGDNGMNLGPVMQISPGAPGTNSFPSAFIYAVTVPSGSRTMKVQLDEHVQQTIGRKIGIPFRHSMRRSTSEVVQIPITFQTQQDHDLKQPNTTQSNSAPPVAGVSWQ